MGLPSKSDNERNLEEIFSELLKNNASINKDLLKTLNELKEIYKEYEYEFAKNREDNEKTIEKWEKDDILKWVNSQRTKEKINDEDFIPELLAVLSRANIISDGYRPRKVQIVSILLFLFTPKDKGLFTQIKTGEGKTTIVAMLAAIKALRGNFVDVLTSSEILAERDSEEKKIFYSLLGLSVTHAKNEFFHGYNIVYGDTTSFEGDFLRNILGKNEDKINIVRGQQCIIIDEVDNMCVDNLSSETRLVADFGGYASLNGIYPLIYQSLNIIDKYIDESILEGINNDINENNRKEKTIEKLIKATEEILEDGLKKENEAFTFPEHIKDYAKNQVKYWCESAYSAKHEYKLNTHYVISGKEGKRKISPVDYSNTGVVQLRMEWSNGLHQFIQLKHGITLENETLNTTFLPHYIFIRKYISENENNIYGLTGTLGRVSTQNLYKKLFGVNVLIIPTFKKSNFINLYPKLEKTEENWENSIIENINNPINNKRVILIICKTINIVNNLRKKLISTNYPEHLIEKYERNDDPKSKLKECYSPGHIIFATNLAGRGTDIKLTDEVEKNGGMHVILTFLPDNQRVEEQALGRTARSGKNGSGIIITKNDYNNIQIIFKNGNGKEQQIKNFDIISIIRDKKEKNQIDYIEKYRINQLQFKSVIFDKFTKLFQNLKKNLKENKGYEKSKIKAIANDVEEKWGLWMKKYGLDEYVENSKMEEVEKAYKKFEESIRNDYIDTSNLNLMNPYNYCDFDDYSAAYNKDSNSCFFAKYMQGIKEINKIENDNDKTQLQMKIEDTCIVINDKLMTSLEAMDATISNLNNSLSDKKEETYDDCKNDIKNKLDVLNNIMKGLSANIEVIENSKGSDKRVLIAEKFKYIQNLTKDLDIIKYFYSMEIYGFYIIEIDVKKDYFGIFTSIFLGALEIIGGTFLLWATGGFFGSEFIEAGYEDIKYGFECLVGKKEFSWSEFKTKKINFLINTAINIAIKLITAGIGGKLSKIKPKAGLKSIFIQEGKKLFGKVAKNFGAKVITHLIGPETIKCVIDNVKGVLKANVVDFFGNQLKKMIPQEVRDLMCINITIKKGKNPIQRLLVEQLKVAVRSLGRLAKIFVDLLLSLFSSPSNILVVLKKNIKYFLSTGLK